MPADAIKDYWVKNLKEKFLAAGDSAPAGSAAFRVLVESLPEARPAKRQRVEQGGVEGAGANPDGAAAGPESVGSAAPAATGEGASRGGGTRQLTLEQALRGARGGTS